MSFGEDSMSKPNAWEMKGIEALACAMWLEGTYVEHWKTVYSEMCGYAEKEGESYLTWEEFYVKHELDGESKRRGFFSLMALIG